MLSRITICLIVFAQFLGADCAYGIWGRTTSAEWKTDVADVVVIGTVTDIEGIDPLSLVTNGPRIRTRPTTLVLGWPNGSTQIVRKFAQESC